MQKKKQMRRILSVLLALTMILNLNIMAPLAEVNAAEGYDIILSKVGVYYDKDKNAIAYADYYNVGDTEVSKDFDMYFYIDGKKAGTGTAKSNGLKKGEVRRVTASVNDFSGTHAITAIADVDDSNVVNNNRTSYRKIENQESEIVKPTEKPTERPTIAPTQAPTEAPTVAPTQKPTEAPTEAPTQKPTEVTKTEVKVVAMGYPQEVEEGDNITITALVQNTGNTDIPAGTVISVAIGIDGQNISKVPTTQAIPAGKYAKVETNWTAVIGGHTLSASLDNSSVSKKINVTKKINRNYTQTSGIDLFVTDIGWYNETTGEKNGSIKDGDKIRFIAYTANIGTQDTPSSTKHGVAFSFNDTTYENGGITWNDQFYGPLHPGEIKELKANGGGRDQYTDGCWIARNGTYKIEAYINNDNSIASETNKNNNKQYIPSLQIPYTVNTFDSVDAPDNIDFILDHLDLGEVTGLTVNRATKSSVNLVWNAAQGATAYNIYRDGNLIGTTTTTSFTDRGTFNVGNRYTYTVKATQTILSDTKESNGETVTAFPQDGAEVVAYPVPEPASPNSSNSSFQKSEISLTANDEEVGVFKVRVYEGDDGDLYKRSGNFGYRDPQSKTNVAMFDYSGDVIVKMKVPRTDINSVTVRPVAKNVKATSNSENGYTIITIDLSEGQQGQYSIELNGSCWGKDTLLLFAQDIIQRPTGDNVRVIDKSTKIDDVVVNSNEILWIEGGVTLNGWVHMEDNSKLMGRGIITQDTWGAWAGSNRKNPLSVGYEPGNGKGNGGTDLGRENVVIDGVSVFEPTGWAINIRNSNDVVLKNVNVISARANGDGITIQSSYDVTIDKCFVRSSDDSIVIKNYDSINSRNIKVSNCVVWTDCANSLEIGYETNMGGGTREEAGYTNNDPRIYNVLFYNNDIIHSFHNSVIGIHNNDGVPVYHIGYKDIRVEDHHLNWGIYDPTVHDSYNYGVPNKGQGNSDIQFDNVTGVGTNANIIPDTFF